ncbi:MAG: amino acid ABC transporter ATP-binding protein [Acidobacteria bacterium]|nr:amino acid ABC transporter ATP-binding protein [Acidobacteriota bacterium]MYF14032.1 amino acid ABC transporter ATP-binding protein [Acidobacteriota bacterium]MYI98008.1 amino acid ABC transporter ATP-binding protein [Acidobacteriota bacterium]
MRVSAVLELRGVGKTFGGVPALRDIHLAVGTSELVALIGPSGSGKSTLLRCCNRLTEPDAGDVVFEGEPVPAGGAELASVRRRMGMVFQAFNLYPHLNALENAALAPRRAAGLSQSEAETAAREALERVGLGDRTTAMPDELSGGQQQRVAIARALALRPRILLLDEPTSALDPELVGSVLRVIRSLKEDGVAMLIATHEIAFAREAADRIAFLADGEILESGPPAEILDRPKSERLQSFLSRL